MYISDNYIFGRIWLILYFDAFTFILHHSHLLFSFPILSHSYYNFYFEVTLLVFETIFFVIKVSKFVPCKPIQLFLIMHDIFPMQAYTIDYYFYHHHYFTFCALQVNCFNVSSIQSIISGNREVSAFFV